MTVLEGSRQQRILALLLAAHPGTPLVTRVCEVSAALLGVAGAGMCLIGGRSQEIVVHGTTPLAETLEDLQLELQEGPCVHAVRTGSPTLVPELQGYGALSWPAFAGRALDQGVRSLFSFPMWTQKRTFGALDLYRETAGPLTGIEMTDALTLTAIATQAMLAQHEREYADGSLSAASWSAAAHPLGTAGPAGEPVSRAIDLGITVGQALAPMWPDGGNDLFGLFGPDLVDDRLVALTDGLVTPSRSPGSPQITAQPGPARGNSAGRQVLVVDDEDGMRLVLGRVLRRLGYRVVLAETVDAGIAKLATHPHLDAVIADITMPTDVGLRFSAAIIEYHPGVPILFLTGGPTASGVLDDPLVALVPKPVRVDAIEAQLEQLIDRANRTATSNRVPATPGELEAAGEHAVIGHRGRRIEPGGRLRLLSELDPVTATWAAVSGLAGLEPLSAVPGAEESTRLANLGLFAAGVANEVNNMLAVVTMRADLLREGEAGQPPSAAVDEDAAAIAGAAARASALAQQLMLFAGQRTRDRGPVDVAALVEDLRSRFDEMAGSPGVVSVAVQPVPEVLGDHEHLERVVLNLVRNALEAVTAPTTGDSEAGSVAVPGADPQQARVRIRVGPAPTGLSSDRGPFRQTRGWASGRSTPGVVIEVADSGQGMTDEIRSRAVEPFFRAYNSAGGSGLGLSTVWGLVSQHGGRLDIDSAPGRGTTVRVTLAADRGPQPPGTRSTKVAPVSAPVDD